MVNNDLQKKVTETIEISLRLIFLFLLIAWCLFLLAPFLMPVLWGIIIAVSASPLFDYLKKNLGGRSSLAAGIVTVLLLAVILVPAIMLFTSVADDAQRFGKRLANHEVNIPLPDPSVAKLPVVGEKLYATWQTAATNPQEIAEKYGTQIRSAGKWIIQAAISITGDIFILLLSIIIAGILLATPGTKEFTYKFFIKMVGDRGEEYTALVEKTIRNVTKGILGVALIQSGLMALIFLLAGVPYVGLLFVVCLAMGIMQIPATPVSIGVIIYLFNNGEHSTTMNFVWSVVILVAGLADNVLKPVLLGKGAPVPMLVIFLGAIGGFMFSGFLGLFTGAIVLSLGYKLFIAWIAKEVIDDPVE
jgi:predicted PurR-regulated permease PerM